MGQMRRAGRKLALLAVFVAAVCVAAVAESSPECGVSNGGHDLVPRPRKITLADGFVDAKTQVTERRDGSLPPEGYRLSVAAGGISIVSSSAAGAFYARKTLEQLLKDGRYRVCEIEDAPEYRWRGMMIDEARELFNMKPLPNGAGQHAPIRGEYYFVDEGRPEDKKSEEEEGNE